MLGANHNYFLVRVVASYQAMREKRLSRVFVASRGMHVASIARVLRDVEPLLGLL